MDRAVIAFVPMLLQVAPILTDLGRQALPQTGCAAYLWQTGPAPQFVAMAEAGALRLAVDGRAVTLARRGASGEMRFGLSASSDFAGEGIVATLDMAIAPQSDLSDGARVPQGTLSVARGGGDVTVVPVAGLVGCTTRAP